MMVLVIEAKAQKLLTYDARKTRRKSFRDSLETAESGSKQSKRNRRGRLRGGRGICARESGLGLGMAWGLPLHKTVTHKSFIKSKYGSQCFKSNIASLKANRRWNNETLKTLKRHCHYYSKKKWESSSSNCRDVKQSFCADVLLTKPTTPAIATVTTNSTKTSPNLTRSNNYNKNDMKIDDDINHDDDNENDHDNEEKDNGSSSRSYLNESSSTLYSYSIVRLCVFTPQRKRRLRKRRKRKYCTHKQTPFNTTQQQHLKPQATSTVALSATFTSKAFSNTSKKSTTRTTLSSQFLTLLSALLLLLLLTKTTTTTSLSSSATTATPATSTTTAALENYRKIDTNDRILLKTTRKSKQKTNYSNPNKSQQHQQPLHHHQQHQHQQKHNALPLVSANFCNSNSSSQISSSSSLADRKISLNSRLLSAYYAVTVFNLFLTTLLTTLAASTTKILLSIISNCLAAGGALFNNKLHQKLLHRSSGGIASISSLYCNISWNIYGIANYYKQTNISNNNKNNNNRSSNRFLFNGLNKYSWIFLLIYLNLSAKVCLAGYHEKRLLHDLLDPYNTLERPVLNESDPLQLSFGLTLMQIIDVDEKNQLLVTNVWLKLEWNDMNLRWNTSDYGGVKDLRIPPHRIWKPDVLMYNSADEGFDGTYQTNVVVRNNGSCLYVPPGIFKSTCKIDITWFPFDDQRCEMKFGSWTYDGFQLDLQLQDETGGDISSYVLNGEWELLGVPGKRNEIYYNCCPEPYIDITFTIIIRRRTLYYFFNLIIPCVLIASMALLGFTLPPDSGEKLSLGVTILLSLTVFLNMVAETMPATSDAVPLLGTYFNCIMFMVASSVVSTILILNYHHRNADTHEMSEWIRIVFLCWLPWILRMSRPGRPLILEFPTTPCSDSSSERKHQILSDVELKERSSKSLLANVLDIDDDFRHNCRPMTPGGTLPQNPPFYRTVYGQGDEGSIGGPIGGARMPDAVSHHTCIKTATEYELGLILKEIRFITDQLRKEDEDNDIANDWKFAAMVVDRLCLIIFTMFTILATIAVLLSAPHIIVS